jgi:hypothetical protein
MARRLVYKGSLNGTAPIYREYKVNDSQTLYQGDVVVFSSNKISAAADEASAGTVAGVCASPITTTTATDSDVVKVDINPASIYEIVYDGTATPAIGTKYDFDTAPYTLDSDDSSSGFLQVVGYPDTDNSVVDIILCNRAFGMA